MAELGMPPGAPWRRIGSLGPVTKDEGAVCVRVEGLRIGRGLITWTFACPYEEMKHWRGYSFEHFGIAVDGLQEGRDGPYWRIQDDETGVYFLTVQVWRRRAFYRDSRVYAEERWHPESGKRASLGGLEHPFTDDDLNRARRGLKLLRVSPTNLGGRPTGSGKEYPTEDSYRAAIREEIYRKPQRIQRLADVPDEAIARWLMISPSLMYDRNRTYGIRMPDIRAGRV